MKKIIILLIGTIFFTNLLFSETNYKKIVALINEQKTITQAMLKNYAYAGMHNLYIDSSKKIPPLLKEYHSNFNILKDNMTSPKEQKILSNIEKLWQPIEMTFQNTPDKSVVGKLQESIDKIFLAYSKLMSIAIDKSGEKVGKIIAKASYERVILERIAGLYMMKSWGVNDPKFKFKLRESINLFRNYLLDIKHSDLNNNETKKILDKISKNFTYFEVMSKADHIFVPNLIYRKTEELHNMIKALTKIYIKINEKNSTMDDNLLSRGYRI